MLICLVNLSCLFLYFLFWSIILFFVYYFRLLPFDTQIRYKFHLIDFWLDIIKMLASDFKNRVPDAFHESGIIIYEGYQGSGKTISMIHDIMILQHKYKKVKVMDNLNYANSDFDINKPDDILQLNNGVYGVITSLDELGIWFNARKFKEFDNSMLQVIFENRKCRRLLMGTVQKFLLCDKNLRIQTSEIRSCRTIGPVTFYIRKIPEMDSEGTVKKYRFKGIKVFVQSSDLRNAYDTFHVIKKYDLSNCRRLPALPVAAGN